MLDNATIANLNALKLLGFAEGLQGQRGRPELVAMTFDERLATARRSGDEHSS